MSRIAAKFTELKGAGRKALIPFVTAGDPEPGVTVGLMHAMVNAGADLLELGVPFSDPMADGPVIQRASERALTHHVGLRDVLEMVRQFREEDNVTPVVLMGYLNPIEAFGYAEFAQQAAATGVDDILTVDLPPEESEQIVPLFKAAGLDSIYLISPTTQAERMQRICAMAGGFVYYVSLKGVTGAANLDIGLVNDNVEGIRTQTDLPVGVGFGISDAQSAAQVAQIADAIVVGSAIVKRVEANAGDTQQLTDQVCSLIAEMRKAIDSI